MATHYETLEVSETASAEAIKGAYKYLAQEWHPDHPKNAGRRSQAEERFKALSVAFKILSDPGQRAIYDRKLRMARKAAQQPPAPSSPPPRPPRPPPPASQRPAGRVFNTPPQEPREGGHVVTPRRSLASLLRLALVIGVSGWLGYKLLGSVPSIIDASRPAAVGGHEPPPAAACVLLDTFAQKDMPNDAVVSYKVRNKGTGTGLLTVQVELRTSRGRSVQQRAHRLDAGEERSSYIAFSLAGTDGKFQHVVRCTP